MIAGKAIKAIQENEDGIEKLKQFLSRIGAQIGSRIDVLSEGGFDSAKKKFVASVIAADNSEFPKNTSEAWHRIKKEADNIYNSSLKDGLIAKFQRAIDTLHSPGSKLETSEMHSVAFIGNHIHDISKLLERISKSNRATSPYTQAQIEEAKTHLAFVKDTIQPILTKDMIHALEDLNDNPDRRGALKTVVNNLGAGDVDLNNQILGKYEKVRTRRNVSHTENVEWNRNDKSSPSIF